MTIFIIAVITSILSSSTKHTRGGVWALLLPLKPTSGSPWGSKRALILPTRTSFRTYLPNSFENDQYHHCNQVYHHHHNALHTQGDVSEHFGCWSSQIRSLQSGSTDAHPPNEDLSSDVSRSILLKMTILLIFTRPTSHWSSVTAQTCSLEHVHVCVRPWNLRRGCGGEAPKKRLTPLIFTRLDVRLRPRAIWPLFKLGGSNSGLKLSIYMAYQGFNLRDLARSRQFNLMKTWGKSWKNLRKGWKKHCQRQCFQVKRITKRIIMIVMSIMIIMSIMSIMIIMIFVMR